MRFLCERIRISVNDTYIMCELFFFCEIECEKCHEFCLPTPDPYSHAFCYFSVFLTETHTHTHIHLLAINALEYD